MKKREGQLKSKYVYAKKSKREIMTGELFSPVGSFPELGVVPTHVVVVKNISCWAEYIIPTSP